MKAKTTAIDLITSVIEAYDRKENNVSNNLKHWIYMGMFLVIISMNYYFSYKGYYIGIVTLLIIIVAASIFGWLMLKEAK